MSALILVLLATFVWAAYREVERTLLQAAGERAQTAANQVVLLLESSFWERLVETRRTAAEPALRQVLETSASRDVPDATAALRSLVGSGRSIAELWTSAGRRVLTIAAPEPADPEAAARPAPSAAGSSVFAAGNRVYAETVVDVRPEPGKDGGSASAPAPLGYLVTRHTISLSPPDILDRLVGDAMVLFGPKTGGGWTNFSTIVAPPTVDLEPPRGISEYRASNGERRIGALAEVSGTPWAVWVEFQRDAVVAPANAFRTRMLTLVLFFVVVSVVLARALMARVTTPLFELSRATEAIAAGDYSRRVESGRRDEIGRLADAFNVMAEHVEEGHRRLQGQVRERTGALEALRNSEARHRAIVEVALDAIITIDAQGLVTEFNPAAERTFGYPKATAVGRELAELIVPPVMRAAHRQGIARYAATGEAHTMGTLLEMTAMRSDGTEFPVELAITPVLSAGPPFFTGVVRDIANRKRAADALMASERAYRLTFDEAPVGIAHLSLEGRILRVNARFCELLGCRSDALVGSEFAALSPLEEMQQEREVRTRLLSGVVQRPAREGRLRAADGRFVWANVTLNLHGEGASRYFTAIIEDMSERRLLEEQLRQAHKMEAVGRLAGGVAHDFNNLLTAILGFSTLVLEDLPSGHPARPALEQIKHAGESAASLTQQLLAFSRQQILKSEIIDLNAVVRRSDSLLQRLIGEDIDLVPQLAPDLGRVCADTGQVEQVIMNIAINARDAMPKGGKLTIETANVDLDEAFVARHRGAQPGRHAMLAISDTGTGMSEATMARIFEPFFTTKPRGEGTGLGLATVYGIVKQSGGWIWVYSEIGQGATFKIYFPIVAQELGQSISAPPPKSLEGRETILLAEDQPEVRAIAIAILTRHGYTVLEASGGDEALRLARASHEPIHLLLTDVVMPSVSGRQLAERLQRERPDLRVLYASGYADDAVVRHGVISSGVAFIQKPFTPQSLLHKVREVLDAPEPP